MKYQEMEEAREKENEEKATAIETTTAEPEHEENVPVADRVKGEEEVIVDTTDNTVDGANDVHHIQSDESPQHIIAAIHAEHPMQQLEADVEIHNFGSSGHLSPLLNLNSES